jgi:Ca2+-binding EF-hand superfamily protein
MNTLTKTLLAASAIAMVASATVLAAERGFGPRSGERGFGPRSGEYFSMHMLERWDADGDGAVTQEEFLTSPNHRFEAADADDDGIVTEDELSKIVEERGVRGGMRFLEQLDTNDDGKLSLEEATQLALDRAKRRFERADRDNDGFITAGEAGKIGGRRAGRHAPRFAGRMMDRFDADNDGQITKAEADEHRQMQFARFDVDDDGQVTAEEMQAGMRKFGGKHQRGWGRGFGR